MRAFVLEGGVDRAPKGRNETGVWWRRHEPLVHAPEAVQSARIGGIDVVDGCRPNLFANTRNIAAIGGCPLGQRPPTTDVA
jgi:hypothetical protein